jgi:predicted lysophospholipase L1 biosynthesis ABC-type transport system permease subunit
MFTLAKLLYLPMKYRVFLIFFLLIWIVGRSTFLTQTLFSVRQGLDSQALENLWWDLVIEQSLPLSPELLEEVDRLLADRLGIQVIQSYTISMFTTLTVQEDIAIDPVLASVRWVDSTFPLYGERVLTPFSWQFLTEWLWSWVWLSQDLLSEFMGAWVTVPSSLTLGGVSFPILWTITRLPWSSFSLFDRGRTMLLDRRLLDNSALLSLWSRISHEYAYRFWTWSQQWLWWLWWQILWSVWILRDELDALLPNAEIEFVDETRQNFARFFSQLDSIVYVWVIALFFLTFAGLALVNSLMVTATQDTFRIVKLLWVSSYRLYATLIAMWLLLVVISWVLWWWLWYFWWTLLPWSMFGVVPERSMLPHVLVALQTVALLIAVSFMWAPSFTWYRSIVVLMVSLLGILYIRFWWSVQVLLIVFVVCMPIVFFYLVTRWLLRFWRYYAQNTLITQWLSPLLWVMRRADQPWSSMIIIGTVFSVLLSLVGSVALLQFAFLDFLQEFQQSDQPNTFILNITQPHLAIIQDTLPDAVLYDTILARIVRINGQWLREFLDAQWIPYSRYSREFNMTSVPLDDEIVWWSFVLLSWTISVDSAFAQDLWIVLWDTLTLSLVGREFTLRVWQLRKVERSQLAPFFFFKLHPDDVIWAPRTYFSLVALDPTQRPVILRRLLQQTSSQLSFIEVDDIVRQVEQLVIVVVGSMSLVGFSILVIGFIIAVLCMLTVLDEQRGDGLLLHILWVTHHWIARASIFALWYPLAVILLSTLFILVLIWVLFASLQSFIPITWSHILVWMSVVMLFLLFFILLVMLLRLRALWKKI